MKRIICVAFSIVCCLTLLQANAQDDKKYPFIKENNFSKSYPASGNSLSIDNMFGKVEIITWNKDEIKVDVHIIVRSNDEEYAKKRINGIKIFYEKNGNTISFTTSDTLNPRCTECTFDNLTLNTRMNYTVHLPANAKLSIKNSSGNIILPDYSGELSIESGYGNIIAGTLSNVKKLQDDYGNVNIYSIKNIDAVFKYSIVEITKLSGNNTIRFEFCDAVKIGLSSSLNSLNINESYSTIALKPEANLPASYTIHTNISSFVNLSKIDFQRTDKSDNNNADLKKTYQGKSGNGSVPVKIESRFGTIIIN